MGRGRGQSEPPSNRRQPKSAGAATIASTRCLVPGVLFSSRKIDAEDPGIEDMAPTALDLFGVATLHGWTANPS